MALSAAAWAPCTARLHAAAEDGTAGGAAVVYVCGYMRDFEQRSFFLPVDTTIDRPTDLLAQGVLPRAFLDAATQSGAKAGMVLLDLVKVPGQGDPLAGPNGLPTSLKPSFGLGATVRPQSQDNTGAKPAWYAFCGRRKLGSCCVPPGGGIDPGRGSGSTAIPRPSANHRSALGSGTTGRCRYFWYRSDRPAGSPPAGSPPAGSPPAGRPPAGTPRVIGDNRAGGATGRSPGDAGRPCLRAA